MRGCLVFVLAACCPLIGPRGVAAETPGAPLLDYVSRPDPSYRWTVKRTDRVSKVEYAELILTSQTWRGITWKHQLFVLKPDSAPRDVEHALLFIGGGDWRDEIESEPSVVPGDGQMYVELAELLKTPVVVLLHVPRQPILGGKHEHAAIAHTFDEYLKDNDSDWPLLLPMVKSAVRAMDAAAEFARRDWSLDLRAFTLTGASKRGWTTWLTSAVDPRVAALAPMVFDILNMRPQMEHQENVYGEPSRQIHDYTERGLHRKMQSSEGRSLVAIVDPYEYRHVVKQPKLIILGTNDPYWTLDALNLYWDGLVGDKYVLYVPNNAHGLNDQRRVFGSLNALHQRVVRGKPLPRLSWSYDLRPRDVGLTVRSDPSAREVVAWTAAAPTRDFRGARWISSPMSHDGEQHTLQVERPPGGYLAVFAEARYEADDAPYFFSTNVRVVEPTAPPP